MGTLLSYLNNLTCLSDSDNDRSWQEGAYFIGYPEKQRVIKGTLNTILKDTASETEKEMLLIYVGDFMK